MDWVTNDPTVAKQLRKIEQRYKDRLTNAANLPLASKLLAIKAAREERDKGIDSLSAQGG